MKSNIQAAIIRSIGPYLEQSNPRPLHHSMDKLIIKQKNLIEFVDFSSIRFCEAVDNYTKIHTDDGNYRLISESLKSVSSRIISHSFFRIHSKYLVNLEFIESIKKTDGWQINIAGSELPISRRKFPLLKQTLNF